MSMHRTSDPSPATRLTEQIETAQSLDGVSGFFRSAAERLTADPGVARALRDGAAGHAAHPMLTDIPLGTWMSAAVLDWTGGPGMRSASQRLVGLGNVAALPTAVTGLAEFAGLDARSQRVASVHAVANYVALGLNVASWLARRGDHHLLGRALTAGAMSVGGFGAFLGGHLAIGKKVGSHDAQIPESAHGSVHGSVPEQTSGSVPGTTPGSPDLTDEDGTPIG